MKIPLEWLNEYVTVNKSPKEIANTFTSLGLLLDKPETNGVLDLEHRMDRSDWLSIIGCARDLAAAENEELKFPKLYKEEGLPVSAEDRVKIEVQCPEIINRFNTRVFKNIKVANSPMWLKDRLESYGIPSINNIVDITNYVMVELGQPMHAQDLAKMEAKEIVIRYAREGETIKTLLGETISLDDKTFVLCQADKPTVIGGIVGGSSTGVDSTTTSIVLDAGNYNQTVIRKTSRRLKIQNETVLRYDKFLHPDLTQVAIERATQLILELAGGEYYFNEDYYPNKWELKTKELTFKRLKMVSGHTYEVNDVIRILTALGYKILEQNSEKVKVEVPYFRTDIQVEDDLVADIVRIYGISNLSLSVINENPPKDITNKLYIFEDRLRNIFTNAGLHEYITSSLVKSKGYEYQINLENALNSEQNALRTTVYETLVKVVDTYNKHQRSLIKVFEIGKEFKKLGDNGKYEDYKETDVTEIIYRSANGPVEINRKVKQIVARLLLDLGIENTVYKKDSERVYIYTSDNEVIGEIKLDSATFYNEALLNNAKDVSLVKTGFTNTSHEDITVELELEESAGAVYQKLKSVKNALIDNISVISEYKLNDKQKAITFRVSFSAKGEQNLTLTEIQKVKEELVANL